MTILSVCLLIVFLGMFLFVGFAIRKHAKEVEQNLRNLAAVVPQEKDGAVK